jgi:hypothetical protein
MKNCLCGSMEEGRRKGKIMRSEEDVYIHIKEA